MRTSDQRPATGRNFAPSFWALVSSRSSLVADRSGFSMIELMITVVFVAMGALMIQGSFLRSADMFGRYSNSLKIMDWMNEECSKTKESILFFDGALGDSESGTMILSGKSFSWARQVESLSLPSLSSIRYSVRCTESGKPITLQNELYVYTKDPTLGL